MNKPNSAFLIFLMLPFVLLTACKKDHDSHSRHDSTDQESEKGSPHDSEHDDSKSSDQGIGLSLNKGEKWQMDTHTRKMFKQMSDYFEGASLENAVTDTLKLSGIILRTEINKLIKGCTMKGAAHDQLHIFLMEFMPAVEQLTREGDAQSLERVEQLMKLYPDYFI